MIKFEDYYKMIALNPMILLNLVQGFDDFNKSQSRIYKSLISDSMIYYNPYYYIIYNI